MRTKTGPDARPTIDEVNRILDSPLRLVITDADAYWIEDGDGRRLSDESASSTGSLARVLALVGEGMDPSEILLCARLRSGERYEVGSGPNLVGVAEAAAGLPAQARTPAPDECSQG